MNVLVSIGGSYDKSLFALDEVDAIKVMQLLRGRGVSYEEDNKYRLIEREVTITSKNFTIIGNPPVPPTLPDADHDAPINQF